MESLQKSDHLSVGIRGEEMAANYLAGKGYSILEKNWIFRQKELDIVAVDGIELVVVEVKTRTEPVLDSPELTINKKKQRNIIHAANAFIRYNRIQMDVRFDIIWIRLDSEGASVLEHIKDAFIATL